MQTSTANAQDAQQVQVSASCKGGVISATVSASDTLKKDLLMLIDGYKTVSCSPDVVVKIYEYKLAVGSAGEGLTMYALVSIVGSHEFPDIGKANKSVVSILFQEKIVKRTILPKGQVLS
jgi:hypothetical protein